MGGVVGGSVNRGHGARIRWSGSRRGPAGLFVVAPDVPLSARVMDRGWDVEVTAIGAGGAEIRWPAILVAPFRGSVIRLHVQLGSAEGIVEGRVVGLADEGEAGVGVLVAWEDPGRRARCPEERRAGARWPMTRTGMTVEVRDPTDGQWGPPLQVTDVCAGGLGLLGGRPVPGLVPGLGLEARLRVGSGAALPFRGRFTAPRGAEAAALRIGVQFLEPGPEILAGVGVALFRASTRHTPAVLQEAGLPVEDLPCELRWQLAVDRPERLVLTAHHLDTLVAEVVVPVDVPTHHASLERAWMDPAYRHPPLVIALWQALAVTLLARGVQTLGGDDPDGLFAGITRDRAPFRVDLGDVVTGAGQSPAEWRRWNAPTYATVVASGQFRPGVLRGVRAALYGAMAR